MFPQRGTRIRSCSIHCSYCSYCVHKREVAGKRAFIGWEKGLNTETKPNSDGWVTVVYTVYEKDIGAERHKWRPNESKPGFHRRERPPGVQSILNAPLCPFLNNSHHFISVQIATCLLVCTLHSICRKQQELTSRARSNHGQGFIANDGLSIHGQLDDDAEPHHLLVQ